MNIINKLQITKRTPTLKKNKFLEFQLSWPFPSLKHDISSSTQPISGFPLNLFRLRLSRIGCFTGCAQIVAQMSNLTSWPKREGR